MLIISPASCDDTSQIHKPDALPGIPRTGIQRYKFHFFRA